MQTGCLCFSTYHLIFKGPSKWKLVTPCWHECGGKRQSPVNIKTEHTHYMPHSLLHFHNLCTRVPGKIRNNGKIETTF